MNKKRNTFIVFEILLREQSEAFLNGNISKHNQISEMFSKYFGENTELGKEINLYFEILSYKDNFKNKDSFSNQKILEIAKDEYKKFNKTKIFNEQTKLLSDIDKKFGQNVFSSFVPEYKILMNLYSYLDDSLSLTERLNITNKIMPLFETKLKSENQELDYIDNIVFMKLTEKFNKKYKELLPEQKKLISKYIGSFGENTADFIIYLNEEILNICDFISKNRNNSIFKENQMFSEKFDQIIEKLSSFKKTKNISEKMIETLLKTQLLVSEIKEDVVPGGVGDNKNLKSFDQREVQIGQIIEKEHTKNLQIVKEIVADHLTENPHYYSQMCEKNLADEHEAVVLYKKLFNK